MERRVVVIGRGKMGKALRAAACARASGACRLVPSSFLKAPRRPKGAAVTWVLALRDAGLIEAAVALAPAVKRGDVVLHLAGMLGPEVLVAAKAAGARVASMHPLCAVVEGDARHLLWGSAFAAEGDPEAVREAKRVARDVGGSLVALEAVDRARYHGAAAMVATGGAAIAQAAEALFASSSTPPPDEEALRAMISSLLRSVASNVAAVGARRALASPLMRDDTRTVSKHLDAMASRPEVRDLYRAAVALVVETLDEVKAVKPETVAEARRLTRPWADRGESPRSA